MRFRGGADTLGGLLILLVAACPASPQDTPRWEASGMGLLGAFIATEDLGTGRSLGAAGSLGVRLSPSWLLQGEGGQLWRTDAGPNFSFRQDYGQAHLAYASDRRQVGPYMLVGLGGGRAASTFRYEKVPGYPGGIFAGRSSTRLVWLVAGAGVNVELPGRWFLRPHVRFLAGTPAQFGVVPVVAVGRGW